MVKSVEKTNWGKNGMRVGQPCYIFLAQSCRNSVKQLKVTLLLVIHFKCM